ncbi:MAG: LON peptidase substrate-binding domain-containing protein [Actinomycetes bacterium]
MRELPMFPLGSVLLPHMVLPLHIFEPRYRTMIRRVLDGDGEFGVVLITRGHEVGGGEQRADLGAVARVLQAQELDDGRWLCVAVGTRRLRVVEWLPDDPHPRAVVEELEDPPGRPADAPAVARVQSRLRRVLALQAELDEPSVPSTTELADDPVAASWQAGILAPLGPLDALALLEVDAAGDRLALLEDALEDAAEALQFRLGGGAGPG